MASRFLAGDVFEVVCQHPTLGEFRFQPKANESCTYDIGGVRANDDASQITGGGQAIYQMNRVRPSFELPIAVDTSTGLETTNLVSLSADVDEGTWTIGLNSGAIYKMKGRPVGDLQVDTNAATMTLKVSGSGKMELL